MMKRLLKILGATSMALLVLFVTGCGKPDYPTNPTPTLHTTISADGQMVATLLNAGTDKQRLRVMRLDRDEGWQEISAPPLTQTIRFGLQGHQLLLTHHVQEQKQDRLVKIDLDKPDAAPQTIYQYAELGFPLEVTPGYVMVRTCPEKNKPGAHQCRLLGYRWQMIGPDRSVQQVGPDSVGGWPQPNLLGTGFFWVSDRFGLSDDQPPQILSYALPNGQTSDFQREKLEASTQSIDCDRTAGRCLRRFISNFRQKGGGPYVYDVDILFGSEQCKIAGLAGSSDGVTIAPNGKAAVMSQASAYDKPRHVVVFRFATNRCEPTSVQHINLEG